MKFIKLLERLSKLYGNGENGSELLFTLNNHSEVSDTFYLAALNRTLVNTLHLLSPHRAGNLLGLKSCFTVTEINKLSR